MRRGGASLSRRASLKSPKLYSLIFCLAIAGLLADAARGQTCAESSEAIAAVVNGRPIPISEVDEALRGQLYGLQERLYNLRRHALDNLITRRLLEDEAKRRGISVEELQKRLVPERVEVQESEVDLRYAENAAALKALGEAEGRQRVRLDLENQLRMEHYRKALAALRAAANIEVTLRAPAPPAVAVSGDGPWRGGRAAPVTLIVFSDFQCPYCKQAAAMLDELMREAGDGVRLVFKHLPLPIHPHAFKAAQAAVCADRQGKFWAYHDRLFQAPDITPESLATHGAALGLDMVAFERCLNSEESRAVVLDDMQEARRADVHGTPTLVINGRLVRGIKNLEELRALIARALAEGERQDRRNDRQSERRQQ